MILIDAASHFSQRAGRISSKLLHIASCSSTFEDAFLNAIFSGTIIFDAISSSGASFIDDSSSEEIDWFSEDMDDKSLFKLADLSDSPHFDSPVSSGMFAIGSIAAVNLSRIAWCH